MLKKQQQNNNINTKSPNLFNYLKSLSQEAKDLIDEIEDANDNIDDGQLLFIGNNKEKFNFNTFKWLLNFLSDIYNGEISLKEAEIKQKNLDELKFNYKPKVQKEKEEINGVLMQANDLFECRDKIIDTFKDGIFCLNILKKQIVLHMVMCWKM